MALAAQERQELEDGWQAIEQQHIELARKDVRAFIQYVMRDEETGQPIDLEPFQEDWQRLAEEHDRLIIWAAMESGKTVTLSIARTLWELGRDPTLRFAIISGNSAKAAKICLTIAQYIETSEELHRVFPNLVPDTRRPWNSEQFTVKRRTLSKDPSVQVVGIGSDIQGARIDRAILDDVLKRDNTRTPYMRQETKDWYLKTIPGRLTFRARLIFIGNAMHPEDLMHDLSKNPRFRAFRFPILRKDGTSVWPAVWPLERIRAREIELGPIEALSQLMCLAAGDSMSRFKREHIGLCLARGEGKDVAYALRMLPGGFRCFCGVDLGVGRKVNNDLSVFFVLLIHPNGDRQVMWVESGRWLAREMLQKVQDLYMRFQCIFVVENNACFPPDAQVLTASGYRRISAIEAGELVLTHQGRWRKVLGRFERQYQGQLVGVKSTGALVARATANHEFFVRDSGRIRGGRQNVLPDAGKHRPIGEAYWRPCASIQAGKNGIAHYTCFPIPKWPPVPPELQLTLRGRASSVRVSPEIALMLGLYLAEGHSTLGQVFFTLHSRERHIVDFLRNILLISFHAKSRVVPADGECIRVVANSRALARVLGRCGKSAQKCMPWEWMGWPIEVRQAIARGWLMGDGCIRTNNAHTAWPSATMTGTTISRNLAAQMRFILLESQAAPSLSVAKPRVGTINGRKLTSRHPQHALEMNGYDTEIWLSRATLPVETLHWRQPCVRRGRRPNSSLILDGDVLWSKVRKVTADPYDGPVYNLQVEEDASYVVEDTVVHNSQDYLCQLIADGSANPGVALATIPIIPFTTGRNKADPTFGLEAMSAEMASGKWIIPNRGGACHPEVQAWIDEMMGYNPLTHSGDRLMASWIGKEGQRLSLGPPPAPPVGVMKLRLSKW